MTAETHEHRDALYTAIRDMDDILFEVDGLAETLVQISCSEVEIERRAIHFLGNSLKDRHHKLQQSLYEAARGLRALDGGAP